MSMVTPTSPEGQLSSVSFPVSESSAQTALRPTPLSRPFRRISLPALSHTPHRDSVVSVSSLDFLPENEESRPGMVIPRSPPTNTRFVKAPSSPTRTRPMSVESPRRRAGRRNSSLKPADDAKAHQRKQVVDEFYATEKTYVDGLELIYSNFLTPIVTSLETSKPLLDRTSLTTVFSNFVDVWNLHRSFFSALTDHLGQDYTSVPPPLSPLLLSHFPYLSLYTPFITSFPSMISTLTEMTTPPLAHRPNPRYNQEFANFVSTQERDPRCGKLKLRDWLLTIVQRCPRYLLLLKDLIKYTTEGSPEYTKLNSVLALVTKITSTLDISLQNHAQILSLLALQRSTTGLPFQLIEPGRTVLKRGSLLQIERSSTPREREFLLFSDCLVWLANEETERAWNLGWSTGATNDSNGSNPQFPTRPQLTRHKSKSEAELNKSNLSSDPPLATPQRHSVVDPSPTKRPSRPPPPVPRRVASSGDERWVFKGKVSLVDIEVFTAPPREAGDERRFEVLGSEGSFALYAGSEEDREDWVSEIRQAKAQQLASLNMINPNSTLTSSSSTNHLRRSLQALPFPPSDERIATIRAIERSMDDSELGRSESNGDGGDRKGKNKEKYKIEKRRKVEHWVPAIWIPDDKTDSCMRCGRPFNWRRRRHHCRLCGRCVCASCSERTFFIADPNAKATSSKPARACDACYEAVFPIVDPPAEAGPSRSPTSSSSYITGTSQPGNDTITSLSKLPPWVSIPALPPPEGGHGGGGSGGGGGGPQAQALMFDLDLLSLDLDFPPRGYDLLGGEREVEVGGVGGGGGGKHARVRLKSLSRPKSYHQILEDFQHGGGGQSYPPESPSTAPPFIADSPIEESPESNGEEKERNDIQSSSLPLIDPFPQQQYPSSSVSPSSSPRLRRKEDTARRSKRFSVPAIALHTTSVTARITSSTGGPTTTTPNGSGNISSRSVETSAGNTDNGSASRGVLNESGVVGRLRRLSLITGGRNSRAGNSGGDSADGDGAGAAARKLAETLAKGGK